MQRRVVALLIGALAALAVSVPPAGGLTQPAAARAPTAHLGTGASATTAAPAIPASALSIAPAHGSSVNTNGGAYSVLLAAGGSVSQTLNVTNNTSDHQFTIGVKPVDATRADNTTQFGDRATPRGSGAWVDPSVTVAVVAPGQTMAVPFTVNVPADTPPGTTKVAGIVVAVQRADPTGAGVTVVDDLPSAHIGIDIGVAGTPAPSLAITNVHAKTSKGTTYLAITVHNSGNVATDAVGTATRPGGGLSRPVRVSVPALSTRTYYVRWQAIDPVLGADVDVELDYGDNNASWVGTVAPDGKASTATTTPDGTQGAQSGDTAGNTTTVPSGSGTSGFDAKKILEIVAAIVAALLLLAAIAFFVKELLGGPVTRAPIDIASMPPIEVTMDPRHTEVLNALVTQVGALGGAVEKLADRVGVPVVLPPGPPLLTPGSRKRRRHAPAHANAPTNLNPSDEPVVMRAPEPAPSAPPSPPRVARAEPRRREHDAITDAMHALPPLPIEPEDPPRPAPAFIAPQPVDSESWPSDDEVEAFLRRRRERGDGEDAD